MDEKIAINTPGEFNTDMGVVARGSNRTIVLRGISNL